MVDDEPLVRASIQSFLDWESEGFLFCGEASNGREALDELSRGEFDLILLDIFMPKMDGLEFLEELAGHENPPAVIVLSAGDQYSSVRKAFRLGAMDYVLKSDMDDIKLLEILKKAASSLRNQGHEPKRAEDRELNYMRQMVFMDLLRERNPEMTRNLMSATGMLPPFPLRLCSLLADMKQEVSTCQVVRIQAEQFLKKRGLSGFIASAGDGEFFLALEVKAAGDRGQVLCESFCRDFVSVIRDGMDVRLDFSVAPVCDSLADLPRQYRYLCSLRNQESRLVRRAKKYIRSRSADAALALEDVSRHVEVSKTHLSAQFRKETGMTFREYLTRLRIEHAERLLRETGMKVYEVSEAVGYPNVEHFSRIFKKQTGQSPARFGEDRVSSS